MRQAIIWDQLKRSYNSHREITQRDKMTANFLPARNGKSDEQKVGKKRKIILFSKSTRLLEGITQLTFPSHGVAVSAIRSLWDPYRHLGLLKKLVLYLKRNKRGSCRQRRRLRKRCWWPARAWIRTRHGLRVWPRSRVGRSRKWRHRKRKRLDRWRDLDVGTDVEQRFQLARDVQRSLEYVQKINQRSAIKSLALTFLHYRVATCEN